jgi:hypothetical protein
MHDTQLVQVLYTRNQLPEELAGFLLLQSFLLDDQFKELALGNILHN